ncbi:glutaminase A [Anaeromicrobium sediminis]|uniref:Glutaminase n=1 Tax=Anaeromicrobium sediminis TaxID=1478221 RepID=A0A267MJN8_9FIRM|nr:glutaminase A [Anaeromicrobium sediminis]PAB59811.1 glutaminase A [Anaeromicrobium sediminis]
MKDLLDAIVENNRHWTQYGNVATYIPELSKGNAHALGVYVYDVDGNEYSSGDYDVKFTIQSVSKIVSFMCALMDNNFEKLCTKISVAPTHDGFNSIVNLETKNSHKPLNPMINSGAIATISMVKGDTPEDKFNRILDFMKKITNNPNININHDVYHSEKNTGDRNRALAYFMKSTRIIGDDVEWILDVYFKLCSMEVTCKDIAYIGALLANDGVLPFNGERVTTKDICKIVKAVMTTCGMYDGSGEFAVSVGVPAKSGVGGGIVAVVPKKMGIGVVGPALDKKGNSIGGIQILKDLSNRLDLSIF